MTNKPKYLSINLAEATREVCEKLYSESIAKVYDYSNKIKLKYNPCAPCEVDTPTISDLEQHTCALCGSRKSL